MKTSKLELIQGTLDMLILKALETEASHGFGLSLRLRKMSQELFQVEMGSLYPALCRLEAQGFVEGTWGTSDNNRRARFYALTTAGRKHLSEETTKWETASSTIRLMLGTT